MINSMNFPNSLHSPIDYCEYINIVNFRLAYFSELFGSTDSLPLSSKTSHPTIHCTVGVGSPRPTQSTRAVWPSSTRVCWGSTMNVGGSEITETSFLLFGLATLKEYFTYTISNQLLQLLQVIIAFFLSHIANT